MNKDKKNDYWVQVDAYCVPKSEEKEYRAQREKLAQRALNFFDTFCHYTTREWAGSQDGEAALGYNKQNELIALIHLDPDGIKISVENPIESEFNQALLDYNEISSTEFERLYRMKNKE